MEILLYIFGIAWLKWFLIIGTVGFGAMVLSRKLEKKLMEKAEETPSPLDDKFVPIIFKVINCGILYFALTSYFHVLDFNVAILGSVLGVFGMAIGLGSRDMIGDLWAALKLVITRPFPMNQKIRLHKAGIEGTVLRMTPFHTVIDNQKTGLVFLPNKKVLDDIIEVP